MIIEHDRNGKEVARYERFTPEKIKEFYNLVGKDNTNFFIFSGSFKYAWRSLSAPR